MEGDTVLQHAPLGLELGVQIAPGLAQTLGHGGVDLGLGLLAGDQLVRLAQQLLHRRLLALGRG